MSRRLFIMTLASLAASRLAAADRAGEAPLWSVLKSGGHVIFLRHALTEPGIGDPPQFRLGDCATQRNLSGKGRADAERLAQAFRARNIPVQAVLSSRWCRCIDTARLAFERVKPAPMLDSIFNERENDARQDKARSVFTLVAGHSGPGNLILVTHAQNIQELTGVSPAAGEIVVVTLAAPDRFIVIGRLDVSGY